MCAEEYMNDEALADFMACAFAHSLPLQNQADGGDTLHFSNADMQDFLLNMTAAQGPRRVQGQGRFAARV